MTSDSWWIGFAAPAVFALLNIVMWIVLLKKDSLFFSIEQGSDDDALYQFKRIYTFESNLELETEWQKMKQARISS